VRRSAETRERLFQAAFTLFAERGFIATTVEDITNAADVGKGTFFNYFPSKEHILISFSHAQTDAIRNFIGQATPSATPLKRLLEELASVATAAFAHNPALVQSLLVPVFSSAPVREQVVANFDAERRMIAELIAARQKRGEVRTDVRPKELARRYQEALFGATVFWALSPSKPLPDCLKDTTGTLWAWMQAGKSSRPKKSL
jgi:AcrR family transcriptional regulator